MTNLNSHECDLVYQGYERYYEHKHSENFKVSEKYMHNGRCLIGNDICSVEVFKCKICGKLKHIGYGHTWERIILRTEYYQCRYCDETH